MIRRKFITTLTSTLICSLILSLFETINRNGPLYNSGNHLFVWSVVYFMYIGAIILIFGNLVSIGVEYFQKKWFRDLDWLYVLILGLFGLANGLILNEFSVAFSGLAAAAIYGVIDVWIAKRMKSNESIKIVVIAPAAAYFLAWGLGQGLSPPMPPFTEENAVEFAVSGTGTAIDIFPEEIGTWEGNLKGYRVKRETLVKEIGHETYVVTFKETWASGTDEGSYSLSYKVKRGSSTLYQSSGETHAYD
jgi:hypothetical protein